MPNTTLNSKDARSKLKAKHAPYWNEIDRGFHLGYRKSNSGGTWYVRRFNQGKYVVKRLGIADDNQNADNQTVFSFTQARKKASAYEDILHEYKQPQHPGLYTVNDAIDDYMKWYRLEKKAISATELVCKTHIRPKLGKRAITTLTTTTIRDWRDKLATTPPKSHLGNVRPPYSIRRETERRTRDKKHVIYTYDPIPITDWDEDMPRKPKSTANRVLTVLKAALNHAWANDKVSNREAWQKVKPFENVDLPRVDYLSEKEANKILAAASDDFRPMLMAGLLTGCRYGELTSLEAADFSSKEKALFIKSSKSNKPRHIPLNKDGIEFFKRLAKGKARYDLLLTHIDGRAWEKSHQTRPMREASEKAGIDRTISFHLLRHTYATLLLRPRPDGRPGVPIRFVAEALGNSVRICEKHYAHVIQDDLRSQIEQGLPSFGN